MPEAVIYRCLRGCTVAIPKTAATPDEFMLANSEGDAFPECRDCTETEGQQDVLWIDDQTEEIHLTRGACTLRREPTTHRNLIPHVCACGNHTPEPAPEQKPDEKTRTARPWTTDEDGTIRVCASKYDAVSLYTKFHPDSERSKMAVEQRWRQHDREKNLIRIGVRCTIVDNGPFHGRTGTVKGFTDDKQFVNVLSVDEQTVYQVAAKYIGVEK